MLKLACATLSIEGFGETNFDKTFEILPAIGFSAVEFNCWYPSALAPSGIESLKKRCDDSGLEPAAIHLNSGLGGELIKDFSHKMWAMEAARRIGIRRIVSSGQKRGGKDETAGLIKSLKALMPAAEEMDMLICLENHKDNTIETIEDYRRIFDAVDSKNLGICIDTGHFDASGVDMDELIDEFATKVNHIHLKENQGKGTKQFTRFTEGTTDNHHVIRRMLSLGYSGYLTIELSPEIGEHDGRPFTQADVELPYRMFSSYEKNAGGRGRRA
jgi:sugar phosphate isomerase/epimerase